MKKYKIKHLVSKLIAVGLALSLMTQSMEGFLFVSYADENITTKSEVKEIKSVETEESSVDCEKTTQEDSENTEEKVTSEVEQEETALVEEIKLSVDDYSSSCVQLSWRVEKNEGIKSYNVYRDGELIGNTNNESYTDDKVDTSDSIEDSYIYCIKAVDVNEKEVYTSDIKEIYAVDDCTIGNEDGSGSLRLNNDMLVKNLYIADKYIDLNGHTIFVMENLQFNSGSLYMDKGKIIVNKDLDVGNISSISMSYVEDYIFVGRNFNWNCNNSAGFYNGVLEIKGDLNDFTVSENHLTLYTGENNTVIFSGEKSQKINLNDYNVLKNVELKNTSKEGIVLTEPLNAENIKRNNTKLTYGLENEIYGWTLTEDQIYEGDLYLISDELNLNGHKLEVTGDIVQLGGEINVNKGEFVVDGDYCLANRQKNGVEYTYSKSNGKLFMKNAEDKVYIKGDFISGSICTYNEQINNGKIYLDGNLIQKNFKPRYGFSLYEDSELILTSGHTHNITGTMTIANLYIEEDSYVNIEGQGITVSGTLSDKSNNVKGMIQIRNTTEIENEYFSGDILYAHYSSSDPYDKKLEVGGTLYVSGTLTKDDIKNFEYKSLNLCSGELSLNKETLDVAKDVTASGGVLKIGTGTLNIGGNLNICNTGKVDMSEEKAYVKVNGNVLWDASSLSELTAGAMEVMGDFLQTNSECAGIECSGTHKVVLSGANIQTLSFAHDDACFNILEIKNTSDAGVNCETKVNATTLIGNVEKLNYGESGRIGWTLEKDETIEEDVVLAYGQLNLNGHTLRIAGDFIQNGGTVEVNGGELIVDGDYAISIRKEKDGTYENGKSTGIIKMNNDMDHILVNGDFICVSGAMDEKCITTGILEVKGNVNVKAVGNRGGFISSKNSTLLLSGDEEQHICFQKSSADKAHISGIEIENTSEQGVIIDNPLTITGKIITHNHKIHGTINITDETTFEENTYKGNIEIVNSHKFTDLKYIEGSLVINGDVDLSRDLEVNELEVYSGNLYLNGYILDVKNNANLRGGNIYLKKGRMNIGGNLTVSGSAYIYTQYDEDYILINKDVIWSQEEEINMTEGTIEVKGNVTDTEGKITASENNKLILSGEGQQNVEFQKNGSCFNIVEIKNTSEQGVVCKEGIPCKNLNVNDSNYVTDDNGVMGWKLDKDETIDGDLIITSNTLDLNGYTLTVNGNLLQKSGDIIVDNGKLIVNGEYRIQTLQSDGTYTGSFGNLIMNKENDEVHVSGDIYFGSYNNSNDNLTKGKLYVGGNVSQFTYKSESNFNSSDKFCLVFNGTEKQSLTMQSTNIRLANVEVQNSSEQGIVLDTPVTVTGLVNDNGNKVEGYIVAGETTEFRDNSFTGSVELNINNSQTYKISKPLNIGGCFIINSNLILECDISAQDVVINQQLSLNGYTLNAKNDITVNARISINGGCLYIEGNMNIDKVGLLYMYGQDAKVYVQKNVNWNGYGYSRLEGGSISVGGNLTVGASAQGLFGSKNTGSNATKVYLTGDKEQVIKFADSNSFFYSIEIDNKSEKGVYFKNYKINACTVITNGNNYRVKGEGVSGWKLESDIVIDEDLYIVADTLDLNGHTMTINGDLNIGSGNVDVNKGKLIVNGNVRFNSTYVKNGKRKYSRSYGSLNMSYVEDYVFVNNNLEVQRVGFYNDNLNKGTLEIKGNIECINSLGISSDVLLSGDKEQLIKSNSTNSGNGITFHKITVENTSREGVRNLADIYISDEISDVHHKFRGEKSIQVGSLNVIKDSVYNGDVISGYSEDTMQKDLTINGKLTLWAGLNVNGHNLDVDSIYSIAGEVLYVNGGSINVDNDMEFDLNGVCLKMDNAQDYVCVGGDFIFRSNQYNFRTHNDEFVTAGTLEIKGDFVQESGIYPFKASGTHTTILSGDTIVDGKPNVQNVSFDSTKDGHFNKLILTKLLETGYVFTPEIEKICNSYEIKENGQTLLTQISGLEAGSVTAGSIELKWNKSNDEDVVGYQIYRNGVKHTVVSSNAYTDTELKPNTDYTYTVSAIGVLRNMSEPSEELQVHTDFDEEPPSAPILTINTKTGSSITLSWQEAVDNCGIAGYEIYRNGELIESLGNVKTYKDSGLVGNTIDVMRERKVLNQHFRNRQITITAKPEDDIDVAKSELIQDGEKIAESKDGIFKIVIGNLKCKRDIFIVSYDGNGEFMEKRMLNIAVNPDPEDEGTSWSMCGGGIGIQSLIGEDKLPRWIRGMQVTQKFPNKVIMLATHEFTDDYYTIGAEAIYNETSGAGSFDFEVGANFKVFDAEEITEGQVYLDSEVEVEYQNQCMVAGIPMVFSTGFSLNGKHSGKAILINSMPDFSIDGQEKAGAELKFGVGVANVISSGIYGGINAEVDWYLTKELGIGVDKIEASGSVGFYLEIVDFEYKEGYDIVPCTIYDKYGNSKKVSVRRMNANSINSIFSSSNNETSDDIQITDEDNYKSASREYLNERSEWDGENKSAVNDIMTLQSSAYTNAKPKVISCNGVTMMLFNDDDETRTDNNRSKLVYSIFNPETKSWSEPVAVNDDGTADYGFDVYDNGKNIYIVWQNADASLDGENSLSDVANHLGISVAKYDCSSGKMISLGNVEGTFNDNQCQAEPKIACHNGEVYVCWYENSENNIFGASGTNTIYYSKLQEENSAAIKIGETQKMITSMDIGIMQNKVYVSYSTGMLETDETESENSIYIVNVSGDESEKTDIPTDSGTNLIFTKYNGNDILSWYENGNIKYISSLNEQSEKMFEEDEIYVNDYSFVSDGDNSSILYSSTKDNKAQAYVINYNNSLGKWDKIVELTNQDKYIENVSGTYADGHLILTFNQTEANIEGENIDLKKSICCMNVEPETKMIIECVKYDQDVIPGGNVELTVNVRNAGMNTIDMARLVVNDSKGKQYATKDFDAMLLSGEAGDYNVKITMPYTLESDEYTFSLYNGDTLCDSYVETLGYADLSVSRRIFNRCGNYSVQADITNNGIEKSSGKVVFYDYNDESNVYYTKAFDELAYEDEVSIVYNVPEELVSDNQKCVIGVKVISDREQKNTENDVVIATINSVTEKSLCIVQFEDVESKTNVIKYTNSEGKISEFPEIPTKEGYVFEGWYREKEKVDVNTVFNNDTVVTAKWSEKLSDKQKEEEDIGQGIAKPIEEETTMKTPEQPNTVIQLPNKTDDGVKRDDKLPRVKERYVSKHIIYEIVQSDNRTKTVKVVGVNSKKLKMVNIPNTITIKGYKYKVIEIGSNAFKSCSRLRKIAIGRYVRKIGSKAFYKCKKLKKITVRSTYLKSVKSNSIRRKGKNPIVFVPKKKYATYKKLFKNLNIKK